MEAIHSLSRAVNRRVVRGALLLAAGACVTAATWATFRYGVERGAQRLPALGKVPAFSLLSSGGAALSQADLAGSIWVADFIFTHCPGLCPVLSGRMAKLQGALAHDGQDAVRLVSFTVDPANDTPPVLSTYAKALRADPQRWLFVTGERSALHTLIGQGFHLAVAERGEDENTDGEGLITHSDRFVLVDRDLQIRGYYHGTEEDSLKQLQRDIATLTQESAQRSAVSDQLQKGSHQGAEG
jgi:protein SCO1